MVDTALERGDDLAIALGELNCMARERRGHTAILPIGAAHGIGHLPRTST
jgi:hypothetical protein